MPFSTDPPQTKSKLDMQKELLIPFDKASAQLAYNVFFLVFPVIATIVFILTTILLLPTIPLPLFYFLLVLDIFFASLAMLFLWSFHYTCRVIKTTKLAMILNAKGIWMGKLGLIPWSSIESIGIVHFVSTHNGIELIIKMNHYH